MIKNLTLAATVFSAIVLASSHAHAVAIINGDVISEWTPVGYCVVDIATIQATGINVEYKWDQPARDGEPRLGWPLNFWDVQAGRDSNGNTGDGFMNISAKIDKISSGNCLTDVAFRIAVRGVTPGAPNAIGGNPYVFRGSFLQPRIWQPGGGGTNRPIGAIYTQEMSDKSQRIVTGVSMRRGPNTWCSPRPALPSGYQDICLGGWNGQGGGDENSYYWFMITTAKYEKTAIVAPTLKAVTGSWEKIQSCVGCGSNSYTTTIGVTNGQSHSKETAVAKALSASLSTGLEVGGELAQVKGTVNVTITGEISEEERKAIANSYEKAVSESQTFVCDKGALWLYTTTLTLSDNTTSRAVSNKAVCTTPSAVPSDLKNIDWQG